MKVLFQCDSYYPNSDAPARRITGLAENLVVLGNDVEVICPLPDYVDGKKRRKWITTFKKTEIVNGVKVNRCFCVPFCNGGTIRRLLNQYSFKFSSKLIKINKPDVVITSVPPLISCKSAVSIARKYKAKLVVDIRDIWPDVAIEMNCFKEDDFKARSLLRIANYLYKNADAITTVSKNKVFSLKKHLDKYNKEAILVSNGVDDFFVKQDIDYDFLNGFKFDKYFSIIHVGKVGNAQDLDSFLEIAKQSISDKKVRFFIIGDGVKMNHILNRVKEENINNVIYCGRRNARECFTAYKFSKIAYVSLVNENLKDSVPTKLYETLFAGCPCLLSASGESEDVVKEAKFGMCSVPGDLSTLSSNFKYMVDNYDRIIENKEYCFNYINDNYNRKKAAEKLNSVLKEL